jgi:hypothetical protein
VYGSAATFTGLSSGWAAIADGLPARRPAASASTAVRTRPLLTVLRTVGVLS